jgi:hypothetical protein
MCTYLTKNRLINQSNQAVSSLKNLAAYGTTDSNVEGDTMISSDTDSSFYVCDNAATGHICKDKSLFSGDLVPLIYIISTANGIDSPTLMGNVNLHLRDNEGNKHEFNLTEVNYIANSPVNLLSLRQLAEHYPNENGTLDQNGTGINSIMTVTRFTGTRSSSPKHFQLQVQAYQNVSLILAILNYWLLFSIWLNSTMTEFTGHLHLKLRLLTLPLMIMVMSLLQWILREVFLLLCLLQLKMLYLS